MTATLKLKQTSIATVRNHILTVACFLSPLRFHYPLPLKTTPAINKRYIFFAFQSELITLSSSFKATRLVALIFPALFCRQK